MRTLTALLLATICFTATSLAQQASGSEQLTVRVENPIDLNRVDEVVELDWVDLRDRLPALAPDRVRVRDASGHVEVLHQLVDVDTDGTPDELLLLLDFRPEETRVFVVEAAPAASAEPRAYAFHEPERDDVAWENERIAFRTYGEGLWELEDLTSSGIDVLSKRTSEMVLDRWYEEGEYHTDTGDGADYFMVGETLGAGGTALWRDGEMYRAPNFTDHRIVADGPIRTIVELEYGPWEAGGVEVTEMKRITFDAGQQLFRSESTFETQQAGEALTYATGLVKRDDVVGSMRTAGPQAWLSVWGPVATSGGGHGDLGTAVLTDSERLQDVRETDGHYLMLLSAQPGQPTVHYAGAGWTAAGAIGDVEAWWDYLDAFARRLEAPLRVSVQTP